MTDTTSNAIETLCAIVEAALPAAERGVKWNGPNYTVAGRDIVTLGATPKGRVRMVLHRGAKAVDSKTGKRLIADAAGRLKWATDQRAHVEFGDSDEITGLADWIADTCRKWAAAAGPADPA